MLLRFLVEVRPAPGAGDIRKRLTLFAPALVVSMAAV